MARLGRECVSLLPVPSKKKKKNKISVYLHIHSNPTEISIEFNTLWLVVFRVKKTEQKDLFLLEIIPKEMETFQSKCKNSFNCVIYLYKGRHKIRAGLKIHVQFHFHSLHYPYCTL